MRTKTIVSFVMIAMFAMILPVSYAVATTVKKYWQDPLTKPQQWWSMAYGKTDDAQLAYNVWVNRQLVDALNKKFEKRIRELEKNNEANSTASSDPNRPGDRTGTSK